MITTRLAAVLALVLLPVTGCVVHRDYLLEIRVQGVIRVAGAESRPQPIRLQLIDAGMDDVRSRSRHVFHTSEVEENKPFVLAEQYFWGSEDDAVANEAKVALRLDAVGCPAYEREYRLIDLPKDGDTLVVDMKSLTIPCGM